MAQTTRPSAPPSREPLSRLQESLGDSVDRSNVGGGAYEKCASAHGNILVLTMQRGHTGMDGEQLRRELPPTICHWRTLHHQRSMVLAVQAGPSASARFAVPYSVLTCQSLLADDQRGDEHAKRICLIGLPRDAQPPALDLLRSVAHIHGSPTLAFSDDDGHLVDVTLHGEDARSRGRALDALDGHAWRGAQITALEGREADQKREVHRRVSTVLAALGAAKDFQNFIQMKGGCSSASSARRLQRATSSLIDDLRANRGSASASAWRKADCIRCHLQLGSLVPSRFAGWWAYSSPLSAA